MAALAWLFAPWLAGTLEGSSAWPRAIVGSLTVGLVRQAVLVVALVRREQGSLRRAMFKDALWLHAPVSPSTGRPRHGALPEVVLGPRVLTGNWPWFALTVVMMVFTFIVSYPARRYRSAVIGIAVHSAQTVVFTALLLALVLR